METIDSCKEKDIFISLANSCVEVMVVIPSGDYCNDSERCYRKIIKK